MWVKFLLALHVFSVTASYKLNNFTVIDKNETWFDSFLDMLDETFFAVTPVAANSSANGSMFYGNETEFRGGRQFDVGGGNFSAHNLSDISGSSVNVSDIKMDFNSETQSDINDSRSNGTTVDYSPCPNDDPQISPEVILVSRAIADESNENYTADNSTMARSALENENLNETQNSSQFEAKIMREGRILNLNYTADNETEAEHKIEHYANSTFEDSKNLELFKNVSDSEVDRYRRDLSKELQMETVPDSKNETTGLTKSENEDYVDRDNGTEVDVGLRQLASTDNHTKANFGKSKRRDYNNESAFRNYASITTTKPPAVYQSYRQMEESDPSSEVNEIDVDPADDDHSGGCPFAIDSEDLSENNSSVRRRRDLSNSNLTATNDTKHHEIHLVTTEETGVANYRQFGQAIEGNSTNATLIHEYSTGDYPFATPNPSDRQIARQWSDMYTDENKTALIRRDYANDQMSPVGGNATARFLLDHDIDQVQSNETGMGRSKANFTDSDENETASKSLELNMAANGTFKDGEDGGFGRRDVSEETDDDKDDDLETMQNKNLVNGSIGEDLADKDSDDDDGENWRYGSAPVHENSTLSTNFTGRTGNFSARASTSENYTETENYTKDANYSSNATMSSYEPTHGRSYDIGYGNDDRSNYEEHEGSKYSWTNCKSCGLIQRNRIVGGRQASIREFPWMVAIRKNGVQHCGGSILNSYYVLTAAHCLSGHDPKSFSVVASVTDVLDKKAFKSRVEYGVFNSNFDPESYDYDVAILKLERKIPLGDGVTAICLPAPGSNPTGQVGVVSGWGALIETATVAPEELRKVGLPIVTNEECQKAEGLKGQKITERMMCAGYLKGSMDACAGDSGGPMVLNNKGVFEQVGIVSWGIGCARPKYFGVYTRVTTMLDWISEHVPKDNC